MTLHANVVLGDGQSLAGGDADAGLHDVDAGDHLGDAVLDLHPRVHLHEVEAAVAVEQELDGADALVVSRRGGGHGGFAHLPPQLRRDGRRGRLLDELLVAPLDAAVALAEVDAVALAVGEHLDLDVPRRADVLLHVHGAVAEGGFGLALSLTHGGGQLGGVLDDADALPAAALSPMRSMDSGAGPMNLMPCSRQRALNSARSARNP